MEMLAPLELGICVADLERMVRFYTEVLQMTHVSEIPVPPEKSAEAGLGPDGYTVVRLQSSYGERIKLLRPNAAATRTTAPAHLLARTGVAYITFIITDLDAMLARLKTAGVRLLSGPDKVEVRPGVHLVFVEDPEGNALEFVQFADINSYRPGLARG